MPPVPEKRLTIQIALSTLFPFLLGLCVTWATMLIGEKYGFETTPFVLIGWCLVLLSSAVWLNHVVLRRANTLLPFGVAVVTILVIWIWQRHAFDTLVPSSGLTYGYFLTPSGAKAGFWVLTCPLRVGLTCLAICFTASMILGWRAGARRTLACLIPWWLTAFLIFSLPSMYLDAQGNASVFI